MKRAALVAAMILASAPALAADYPPVGVLQDELHAHPGDDIAKLVPYHGRLLQPRYLSAHHDGNGVYTIRIKLDERRDAAHP